MQATDNTSEAADRQSYIQLENYLPYQLSILSNRVSQGIAATYSQAYDLSIAEWRVLAVLGRFSGITASQVVARTAMDKVAISRTVKKLLEKRLVERRPTLADKRRLALYLSPPGNRLCSKIVPAAMAYEQQLLEVLELSEREQLQGILDKLQSAADRHLEESAEITG